MRSSCNFSDAQDIRDTYADILASEPRIPEKKETFHGDPGNLEFNKIMYDELENADRFLQLLAEGGDELIVTAQRAEMEDDMILGPDLAEQIEKKIDIMRVHWRDIEDYLAPPHK